MEDEDFEITYHNFRKQMEYHKNNHRYLYKIKANAYQPAFAGKGLVSYVLILLC